MNRRSPICGLDSPSATRPAIECSVGVRLSQPDRGRPRLPRRPRRPPASRSAASAPERPGALQLGRPGRRHPQAAAPRRLQRVLEQPRLADAGLPVDQHDGQAPGRRPVDGVVQDRGLRRATADTRDRRQHFHGRRPGGLTLKYLCAHELTLLWVLLLRKVRGDEAAGITRK
jgi:hypothetical protein